MSDPSSRQELRRSWRSTLPPALRPEGGQVLPLVLVAIVMAGAVTVGLVHVAVAARERASVQAAADAAALAGAAEGEAAARELAEANDGELTAFRRDGVEVEVVVRRHEMQASARARWVSEGDRIADATDDRAAPAG